MIFKPLVISGPMMRAYLADLKTQTRRMIKPQPDEDGLVKLKGELVWHDTSSREYRPPIQPSEFIWWREGLYRFCSPATNDHPCYSADGAGVLVPGKIGVRALWPWKGKRLSSRFMPKWACRAVAEVEEVRAERVQNISEEDAIAEGFASVQEFADYWNKLHGRRAWERNDWIWIYRFRPLKGEELKKALEVLSGKLVGGKID